MVVSRLESLALEGFRAVPDEDLRQLAEACQQECEDTGNARYCVIAEMLRSIYDWWKGHSEFGGVPTYIVQDLEDTLRLHLPPILRSDSPAEAALLASMLRSEIMTKLVDPSDWK
jgi:hypothetical protein